jgi:hypothetical protein
MKTSLAIVFSAAALMSARPSLLPVSRATRVRARAVAVSASAHSKTMLRYRAQAHFAVFRVCEMYQSASRGRLAGSH